MPTYHSFFFLSFNVRSLATCCISTLARFELIFRNSEVLRFLSEWSRFCLRWRWCSALRASLLCAGSRFLPPVLILVFSSGVLRSVTWSPPLSISWRTCVWYRPCTASPFMWVIRSPGRKPASNAGLDWSTAYNWYINLSKVYINNAFLKLKVDCRIYHNQVMHRIKITVAVVHSYRMHGESKSSRTSSDDYRRFETGY